MTMAAISPSGTEATLIHETALIHPLSAVTDSAVGAWSQVWQFASVIRGAVIGEHCSVASGAIVDGSRAGNRCLIAHNAGVHPGVLLMDGVFVGPNATLCNDMWPRALKAGFPGFVPAVAFGDVDELAKHMAIVVESGASIGAGATVLPGIVIGRGAMIAAGAVVTRNVPAWHLWGRDGTLKAISVGGEAKSLERRTRLANCL